MLESVAVQSNLHSNGLYSEAPRSQCQALSTKMPKKLTDRQRRVLDCIRAHVAKRGVPPSRSELARELGYVFPSGANGHLDALERKGWIHINRGLDRGIRLLREGVPVFDASALPAVAAGEPMFADEDAAVMRIPEEVTRNIHPRADAYLRVQGDSMDELGYASGDLIALQRNPDPAEGEIVVAKLGDAIMLKRFHRTGNGRVELQPQSRNPEHKTIRIDADTEDFEIVGVVVGAMVGAPSHAPE